MRDYVQAIQAAEMTRRTGRVVAVAGDMLEAAGPRAAVGEVCDLEIDGRTTVPCEVVGIRPGRTILMPQRALRGVQAGCLVRATGRHAGVMVGDALLGRVIDAFGAPLDGRPAPAGLAARPLNAPALNPLARPAIDAILETGVRAIDAMLPLGRGQRIGIFAGSGVGKSTLLGMMARHVEADVNVIALIGERGREVREFIEHQLGEEGLARSVMVVATADQSPLARTRAAYTATVIAEHFRAQRRDVLLMMDSLTRLAMGRREIGLAAGEPPTARGYTPSIFSEIPALCERCGTAGGGGSITALYTVLVDGDDFNEPISDTVRATLDGHIMLSRDLAQEGHFPAIDILQSTSRLAGQLATKDERQLMRRVLELLATYQRNRQMVDMGAYRAGASAAIDQALACHPGLTAVLRQQLDEPTARAEAVKRLAAVLQEQGA
ncbi:FliI/YscN family ATPase [Massilia forsythiae]|uniref:FliI/YscN family ATPase n=1 Tax=Massilia forsythiae TaxID=2728020 RepID=A0A7Z2ZRH6_9BURK|nr:FliI/YscN family ATPase [Massilia forsythiae]QJD99485.1 FliI/YscN family ATPase [Massilia forsythiae]